MQLTTTQNAFVPMVAPSILGIGTRPSRIPICGRIRPGIKVLKKEAAKNPDVVKLFEAGVAAGKSYDDIERQIKSAVSAFSDKDVLIPQNAPYFTVLPGDFQNPKVAEQIMDLYGEVREDGVRRLYSLKVIFPVASWQMILPHTLKSYIRNELQYWAEVAPDGTRKCMTHAAVAVNKDGSFVRPFGGIKSVPRPDTKGACNPEACPQYQNSQCKVSGEFVFYIPGIQGLEAFAIPTTSLYSIMGAMEKLEMIQRGGGQIAGRFSGDVVFRLSKQTKMVSRIDLKDGKRKRVEQELIILDADIDMAQLLRPSVPSPALIATEADEGFRVLTGQGDTVEGSDSGVVDPKNNIAVNQADKPAVHTPETGKADLAEKRQRVLAMVTNLKIDPKVFKEYADLEWGEGWGRNLDHLSAATRQLQNALADNGDVYAAKVNLVVQLKMADITMTVFEKYAKERWAEGWDQELTFLKEALHELASNAADLGRYRTSLIEAFTVA